MFGAYMLRIDISSWCIVPLINMKWPSLSLLTNFSLKSTLSDVSMATPACLWGPFAWKTFFRPLTLSQYSCFSVRWVFCKQHMVGSCFLTQFAILCLLTGALKPFTFSVNIERCFQSFLFPLFSFYLFLFTGLIGKGFILSYIFLSHCSFFLQCVRYLSVFSVVLAC
jgi:hypothetical protein